MATIPGHNNGRAGTRILGFLQRFFNLPFHPDDHYLQDVKGRKFWVHYVGNQPLDIMLSFHSRPVGEIRLIWEVGYVEIADFTIFDWKFRRYGFGSQMFNFVKGLALKNNKIQIRGIISPTDKERVDFASLVSFYQKQGCQINGSSFVLDLKSLD
jgi:hypothetical protein